MEKILDFTNLKQPTFPIVLRDGDGKLELELSIPTLGIVERIEAAGEEFDGLYQGGDVQGVVSAYRLVADILSHNQNGIRVTAEDLRDRHKMNLYEMRVFCLTYRDFMREIESAKN